jgi:antitoxin (DNA-binding transcriptional repressor) of toxin-antitoxin stability system
MRTIAAGEFKAKCLGLIDEVKATGETVHITKRGKIMARLTPPEDPIQRTINVDSIFGAFRGMMTVTGEADDLIEPIIAKEEWDHLRDDWSPFPPE